MRRFFLLCTLFLGSCMMVGPDYKTPRLPMPTSFNEAPPNIVSDSFFEWWHRFEDPLLDELLKEAYCRNYDLKIAVEKICQARADFYHSVADLFPQFTLDTLATRSKTSQEVVGINLLAPKYQNFYLAGVDAAWTIDIFGGLKRAKRAAFFNAQSVAESANATQILVLSEVASQYSIIRALQQKARLQTQIIEADSEELYLIEDKLRSGLVSGIDVETFRSQLASDVAYLDYLEVLLKQGIYAIAPLIGQLPEITYQRFCAAGPIPNALGKLPPSGLPSQLLCRRPDIRQAERALAAATEQIGVAVANLFPQFFLASNNLFGSRFTSSNVGFASNSLDNLFKGSALTWSIGGQMTQTLLDFGRNLSNIEVQTSLQRQSLFSYEKTVLTAIEEVESALATYFEEEQRLNALTAVVESDRRSLEYNNCLFQAGLTDYFSVLNARRLLIGDENILTDSQQALATNLIALYRALGGEWQCSYLR